MNKFLSIAALGAALLTAPAIGQAPVDQSRQVVRTSDLDLRSDAGMAKLDKRIEAAVRAACGDAFDFDVRGKNEVRACREETRARISTQRTVAIASAWKTNETQLATQ